MNKLFLLVFSVALVSSLSSCTLWRKVTHRRQSAPLVLDSVVRAQPDTATITKSDTVATVPSVVVDSSKLALLGALQPLWTAQTPFNTFSGKAKVNYETKGDKEDFTANIRIERDKKIWVSITALGGLFEAARVLITPDSIMVLDRVNHEVQMLPFTEAGRVLPVNVDFHLLQSLMIGDVLNTGKATTEALDTNAELRLAHVDPDFTQLLIYNKADTLLRSQSLAMSASSIVVLYSDYGLEGGRHFARSRTIDMSDKGDIHHIELDFNKVDFDQPVNMDFSIPSKYTRK